MAEKRLFKEYNQLIKSPPSNSNHQILSLSPKSTNEEDMDIFEWEAIIAKPTKDDSPYYYNGKWKLDISVSPQYPINPPSIKFNKLTPINHPNINFETGEICLDILKNETWSPAWNLTYLIMGILMLVDDPEPDSPLNIDLANLWRFDKVAFESIVQYNIWQYNTFYDYSKIESGIKEGVDPDAQVDEDISMIKENLNNAVITGGYHDEFTMNTAKQLNPSCQHHHSQHQHSKSDSRPNYKVIHDVGEEVTKQFIAKVNEIGYNTQSPNQPQFNASEVYASPVSHKRSISTDEDELDTVRQQVTQNVTKQVEQLCLKSTSPEASTDDSEEDYSDEASDETVQTINKTASPQDDEETEKIKQQFLKQVDDKVNEVRKKQEEYQKQLLTASD